MLFFSLTFAHSSLTHVYVLPIFNFCVCDVETPAGCCISTILGWYHWIWSYWTSIFINMEVCQSQNRILRPRRGRKIVGVNNNAKDRYLLYLFVIVVVLKNTSCGKSKLILRRAYSKLWNKKVIINNSFIL